MFFAAQREVLRAAQSEASAIFETAGVRPKVLTAQNLSTFWGELGYSLRLIVKETEIVFFAALQWLVVALAYGMWTRILDWIPRSVWEQGADDTRFIFLNVALLAWSFFIIAVASYPLSILNAAITAAHYLRNSGQESTIARCLGLAYNNLGRLWVFTAVDAWITTNAIIDRIPSKHGPRTALDELLYYAWKTGTIGIVPALVAGKGYKQAVKESIALLREKSARAIGIRMGYSLLCWIIGFAAYAGTFYYLAAFDGYADDLDDIYKLYLLATVPILIAVGIIAVLVRPFYLVMTAKLYSDIVPVDREATVARMSGGLDTSAFIFAVLLSALLLAYFLGDALGVREFIEALAERDLRS